MKTYCNICKIETNQKVIHETEKTIYYDPYDDYTIHCYQIVECEGCNEISFRTLTRDKFSTEIASQDDNSPWRLLNTYPLTQKDFIISPRIINLPAKIKSIFSETIKSFNNNCFVLCAAGIRSIIESVHTDKIKSEEDKFTTLGKKIVQLAEGGVLTKKNSKILDALRFLGNKALHELQIPTKKELKIAIEIIIITLNTVYHIESISNNLKNIKKL